MNNKCPVGGMCYHASEALYHMLGGKANGWTPQVVRVGRVTHWFLRHRMGFIIDPTAHQFKTRVPYEKARGCGFVPPGRWRRLSIKADALWARMLGLDAHAKWIEEGGR